MFKRITEFESSMCRMSSLSYPLTRKIQDGIIHRVAISRIMMPHISAIFLLLQSLEYLTEASWSRVVPHRFTVSLGRRTQPIALVWHRNGHCKVPLGECVMPVRGHSLWGTISWNLQLLNTGGWSVPAPTLLHHVTFGRGCCSQWYGVLPASEVGPAEVLRCGGDPSFPYNHSMRNSFWKLYGKRKWPNCCLYFSFRKHQTGGYVAFCHPSEQAALLGTPLAAFSCNEKWAMQMQYIWENNFVLRCKHPYRFFFCFFFSFL